MELNIQNSKIELIQWLTTLNDKSMITKLMEIRKNQTANFWNELSEEEKESIQKGIADADVGKLNNHSEAKKLYEKWL